MAECATESNTSEMRKDDTITANGHHTTNSAVVADVTTALTNTVASARSEPNNQPEPKTRRQKIKAEHDECRITKRAKCKDLEPSHKKRKHVDLSKFPRVSQRKAIRCLQEDFGLEVLDSNNNCITTELPNDRQRRACRFQGKEYSSVEELRDALCRTGLFAPSEEWFYLNMTMPEWGKWYLPSTQKAKNLADWIRLAMVPVSCLKAAIERLKPVDVKKILAKMGIKCVMGDYTMDGQQLRWEAVERRLATEGFSEILWNHPGATTDEKLSVMLYALDYKTM